MALPEFSMRLLLEAGAHFGHQTRLRNPKMDRYIFGSRSGIHIIDLSQTIPLLHQALVKIREVAASGGRVLFVGTKRQASDPLSTAATRCAQYYINHRWLGGTLTNWRTVSASIARLRELEAVLASDTHGRKKREVLQMTRERNKLDRSLGGIREMGGLPDLIFVIDTNKEALAVKEARKLNIPVVAILDSNSDPDGVEFPIPGNDDAARAIQLYCDLVADAALDGLAAGQAAAGMDLGAAAVPIEPDARHVGVTPAIPHDSPAWREDLAHDFATPQLGEILSDTDVALGVKFENRSYHAAYQRKSHVEFECSVEHGEGGTVDDFIGRWEWKRAPIASFARMLSATFDQKSLDDLTIDILTKDMIETYQVAGAAIRNGDFVKHISKLVKDQDEPIGLRAYYVEDPKRFELFVSKILDRDVTLVVARGHRDLFPLLVERICETAQHGSAVGQRRGVSVGAPDTRTAMTAQTSQLASN